MPGMRRARLRRVSACVVLAAALALLVGTPTTGIVLHSITIDGNVSDWADVLTDPENVVADAGSFSDPVDPDVPGTADRDLRGAAFTYDATNLYLFFRRTLSGNSAFEYLAYVDLGHDGRLNATDVVVRLSYNGAAFSGGSIRRYVPVDAVNGDPVTGDGVDEPGTLGATLPGVPTSANSPDGIEFEAAVPWTALGVPSGTCLIIHPSISRGVNLPGQVEDNADPLDTQDVQPTLQLDQDGSTSSPGQVDYAHVACNEGSCTDTLDLTVRSGDNWRVQIWSDPNGDGDPSDGVLLATDGNGDGDYSDDRDGDALSPGADSNGNELLDTGPLAADGCFRYVVRVFVPSGVTPGTMDVESVRARSAARPRDLVRNTDRTNVGPLTVFADENATAFPGDVAWLPHWTCNHQAFADTFLLSATSTRGWPVQVFRDPNGDGDPSDAVSATSVGPLAPGECAALLVRATVPAGEAAGVEDQILLRATSSLSASVTETALDRVTVAAERFSLVPNHDRDAGPGNVLFLPHVITNHQGILDSFQLTATSADATYTITLLTDPNGDGEPDDSATIPGGSIVGPVGRNGGELRFLVRVDVPSGAAIGSSNTVTVTIRSQADTTRTDVATDIIRIRRILTYSDPLFARPSKTFFTGCSLVYVQAHGLQVNREYRFLWIDPAAVTQRTSPAYNPDARGRSDDAFALPCGPAPGGWSVKLQIRSGSAWNDVADATATFTTLDPAADGGDVTRLEADQPVYDRDGDAVSVEATFENDTDADYLDTFADYVVFKDENGDGQPTAWEPYILADGSRSTWDPGEQTHRTEPIGILSGDSYEDYWRVDAAQFDLEGTWCVHVRWVQRCNSGSCSEIAIDTALTCFLVSCLPAPVVDAGAPKQACDGDAVALDDAASDGNTHSWSDGGAGGTFSPSSTVLQPQWTAPGPGSYTLTLASTFTATGCTTQDTVAVTIHPEPSANAGTGATTCAGETVATGASATGDVHAWDDGGAGGTFTPSAAVASPSYTPPDPSPASITLTLTTTVTATGCSATDTATIVVDPNPAVDAGADAVTCAGDALALSDATSSGDAHAWSDGGAGGSFVPSASVLNPSYVPPDPSPAAITLTLQSTVSATGCSSSDTRSVTVNANPVASAGADLATCAGEGVAMAATSDGDAHSWSDGGAGGTFTPSASVLSPTYVPADPAPASVTLTLTSVHSATGCDTVDALTLTVNPNPVVSAGGDATTCAGVGIALSSASSDGSAHSWSDGGAGGTFSPSAAVLNPTYAPPDPSPAVVTLTLTSSVPATGCDSSDALVLTVNPRPAVTAGADRATCAGAPVALSDADGGIADTFAWSDGGAGGTFTPSASVENPSYANATPGARTLTLTATVAATGCSRQDTVVVTVNAHPSAEAGAPKEGCAGAPIALSDAASDAPSVSWSDGGAGGTFSPSSSALNPSYSRPSTGVVTLTLTATSAEGCVTTDTVEVTVRPVPVADFAVPATACEDAAVCFDDLSTDATAWSWTFGDPAGGTSTEREPCYAYSTPGTYDVTLTASNACGAPVRTRTIVIGAKPVADFSFTTQGNRFCRAKDVSFTDLSSGSPTSWSWDFGDGTTSTEQSPVHQYATDGVFIVRLTACNGCGCGAPRYRAVEIAATCNTNCEANSNQIECADAPAVITGDTCAEHDNFNTTSYACAPGLIYGGENKSYDLDFLAGANFVIRIVETVPEPNGYDLDLIVSDQCNPPRCVAWGDTEVRYDDRTAANDDFFLVVDGRDGSCGPYRLEVECLDPADTAACAPPAFAGVVSATDENACLISGVVVAWDPASSWGLGPDGSACAGGVYEIWRAPAGDPSDERRVGTAAPPAVSFLDLTAVPGTEYVYRVHAINDCCGEPALTTATANATDQFGDQPVLADAGPDRTLTCDAPAATLNGSADGGTGSGFTWSWSPAAGLSDPGVPNPVASAPGTYVLTVTDAGNGCQDTDSVTVASAPVPVATAGPDRVIDCVTTTVTLAGGATGGDPSGGRTFSWSPAGPLSDATIPTPTTSTAGTYVLTVTDLATGCVSTDSVAVTRNDAIPTASAGPDLVLTCAGPVTLTGSASGGDGSGGYLYSWSPATGLDDPSSASPVASVGGTWTLVVTDAVNGCTSAPDDVTVTENLAAPVAGAGPDRVLSCSVPEATLDGSASGGDGSAGYAYAWSPAENVSDPSAEDPTTSVPGTYVVTVTDLANACTSTDEVVVSTDPDAPVADAGPDQDITCTTGVVRLQGSASGGDDSLGYEWHWEPAADVSDPSIPDPTTSVPGVYTLQVTTPADGCRVQDVMVVHDETAPPVADAGPGRAITCAAGSVTLLGGASGNDGRAGFDFAWEPAGDVSDASAPSPQTSVPGTYELTVTDRYTGCTSRDSVTVADDRTPPVASAGADKVITCAGPSVTLDGGGSGGNGTAGYAYSWSPAAGLSDPLVRDPSTSVAGTWTVTVTDLANGCTDTDDVTVTGTSEPPVASAGPDRVLDCRVAEVVLQGGASGGDGTLGYDFAWEPSSDVSDAAAQQPTTSRAGTYTVTVTDRLTGCTATDAVTVTLDRAPPVANAGPDAVVTCVTPATLTATDPGGYDFAWTPSAGLTNPNGPVTQTSTGGTYTLTVTDRANGCTDTDTVFVAESQEPPAVTAGPDLVLDCDTAQVTLLGDATGGDDSAGYTYAWDPPAGLSDPAVRRPTTTVGGTWTLTATARATGCFASDVVTVAVDRDPPIADAGPDKTIDCASGPSVVLDGSASGGNGSAGYSYSWSPPAGLSDRFSPNPRTSQARTYTLTVTDLATGCTATDIVVVGRDERIPAADAGPSQVIPCSTGVARLQGSASGGNGSLGYAFSWTPAAGLDDPSAASPLASAPGVYTLRVRDLANGCEDTDTVTVTRALPPGVTPGPAGVLDCDTASATLTATVTGGPAGRTFAWSPVAGVADPAALTTTTTLPGDYTLTVTDDATGCASSVVVGVTEDRRAPVANAGGDRVMGCDGSGGTLVGGASGGNGSLGYDVAWSPAALVSNPGSLTTQALGPATFTLTITDRANGCTSTDDVVVTQPVPGPVADAGPDGALSCATPAAGLTGAASGGDGSLGYDAAWTPTLGVADPASLVTTTTEPGTYTLTVTDRATGCSATDTVTIADGPRPPVADAGADVEASCAQPATLLGAASGGSGAGYAYSWTPAVDLSDPASARPVTTVPGDYTLTVTDLGTGCASTDTVTVLRAAVPVPPDPSALDLRPGATPLLVRPVDRAFAQIEITWEDVGAFTDHLYQGTIAAVGPPAGGAYDHAPAACGLAASSAVLATPAGNVYFLAVAANCAGGESSYGRTSRGQERPAGVPACP